MKISQYCTIGLILGLTLLSKNTFCFEVQKWETVEILFQAKSEITNPFEVGLKCIFTKNNTDSLVVPGFYNGNRQWMVRFTPNSTGKWNYISHSTIKEMNGIKKTIEVIDNDQGNAGSIQICQDDPKKFCYENGDPYHVLAFEADWLFALDYGNPELPKTRQLLSTISDNGFNQIVMNVYAFDASWIKDPDLPEKYNYSGRLDIFPFKGDNENPDHSGLNIDFFKHLDRVIELLADKKIAAHLMIYVWNKHVNWPVTNSEADNRYFDYVIKRYQAYPNIIWDISKEALAYGHTDMDYITNRIDRLSSLDAYNRLVTVHDYKYCREFPEKVDFISVQTWKTDLYNTMLDISDKHPDKPILNIEHGGYEEAPFIKFKGDYADAVSCLRRNYRSAFAGTYTTYYWQGTSWYVIIHDPFAKELDPHPKFNYYMYFSDFLNRIEFNELEVHSQKVLSSSGLCLHNEEKGTFVYYIPADNNSFMALNLPKVDNYKITWFNPLTGEYVEDLRWWEKESDFIRVEKKFSGVDEVAIIKLNL